MQKISKLLLFAIFAFAARYADVDLHHAPPGDARQWIAGSDYAYHARRILGEWNSMSCFAETDSGSEKHFLTELRHDVPRESDIYMSGIDSSWCS